MLEDVKDENKTVVWDLGYYPLEKVKADEVPYLDGWEHPHPYEVRHGVSLKWTVRNPRENFTTATDFNAGVCVWHTDAYSPAKDYTGSSDQYTYYVLIWNNQYVTELRLPNGEIYVGRKKHLILFDNALVKHRVPLRYQALVRRKLKIRHKRDYYEDYHGPYGNRWFMRGFFESEDLNIAHWRNQVRDQAR